MGSRQARLGRSKRGISIERGLELSKGFLKLGPGAAFVELKATFQVTLVNSRCHRACCDGTASLRPQRDLDLTCDAQRHVALQRVRPGDMGDTTYLRHR